MPRLAVTHVTRYDYARPVRLGEHRMMLRPRDSHDQRLLHASLAIDPEPARLRWIHDVFNNSVAVATFDGETKRLEIRSEIALDHSPTGGPDVEIEQRARRYPFAYDQMEIPDLARAIEPAWPDSHGAVNDWARRFVGPDPADTARLLMTMTNAFRDSFTYVRREEPGVQSPFETLTKRRGSCRDYAVLMMEACRNLGMAARFVTGYLYVPDRDTGRVLLGGGSTHAWCQIYLPGAGWVDFDPTNGIVGSRDLIRVAVARDPKQAAPLTGSFFGRREDEIGMTVAVTVLEAAPEPSSPDEH
jgi:transglutaminase-like putative cysteine protease